MPSSERIAEGKLERERTTRSGGGNRLSRHDVFRLRTPPLIAGGAFLEHTPNEQAVENSLLVRDMYVPPQIKYYKCLTRLVE